MILNTDEANQAIELVCNFLMHSSSPFGIPANGRWTNKMKTDLTVEYCHKLLEAAKVEDLGGCPLCQS